MLGSARSWQGKLLLAACIALASGVTNHLHAQTAEKRVLVLYSTRRDAQFSAVGERELPRILEDGSGYRLDYYAEFLDLSRSPDPGYRIAFRDFLRQKYNGVRFDLVIAMQGSAINFVNDYGDDLFPDTPLVYLANNPGATSRPNSTGFILQRNFAATAAFIRQVQPDVQQIFVITGDAATDRDYEKAARQQLQPMSSASLTFTYLSGLTAADLEARLANMPKHSAAYYVIVSSDPAGARPHPLNYLDHLAEIANGPIYSWVDSTVDHGIVGGSLYKQDAAVQRLGELARRVLNGEPAGSISPVAIDLNTNEVDWRQLRRWRIDERRLPAGTVVRFRDPTLWDEYWHYIVAAVALLALQTALIAGLLIQRARRRRVEQALRESQAELLGSYERNRDLASRLLRAQEMERSRIARDLHDDICQRMLLLTIELEAVVRRGGGDIGAAEALTVARDISSSLRDLSHELHPARLRVIGLVSALESLCSELSRAGVTIAFSHRDVPSKLPPDVMLCLFRVTQEGLQNALKYSHATELAVDIRRTAQGLMLTISDNGVGFDVDAAWRTGVGLGSMVERVQALGGSLDVKSRPQAGTRLTALLPEQVLQADARETMAAV